MSYFVVDVESDAESPANGSMVCFGVVKVSNPNICFYGRTKPICRTYNPDALKISGFSREEHEKFSEPIEVMKQFNDWLIENSDGKPVFISDNIAFDWQWINYYFHKFLGKNPFGFSGRRIGDLYCGMVKHAGKNNEWKRKFRKTKHDHNPVNDAKGNAEALLEMQKMGLNIKF
jgi:DNA polymerase III epsilon subunit-like protein